MPNQNRSVRSNRPRRARTSFFTSWISLSSASKKLCAFVLVVLLCAGIFTHVMDDGTADRFVAESATPETTAASIQNKTAAPEVLEPQVPVVDVHKGVVGKGDTASSILNHWLGASDIYSMANQCKQVFSLSRLRKGQPYRVFCEDGEFSRFEYEIDKNKYLSVLREEGGYKAVLNDIKYEYQTIRVDGEIEDSLYAAVRKAGEHPALAVELADIFGWEVDFIRDIRKGDSFTALVEKRYRDGKFKGYGRILAAAFINKGDRYEGFLYPDMDGTRQYYTSEGRNLRRAFLKAPLSFRRISSNFSLRRFHPILKKYRPHYGIDYAAPIGTPVHAIGDGVVTTVTRGKGAGKYVKVRHKNGYESAYLHLSRFKKGIKRGKKVRQGDVIAYVGSTGYSTGPHLDFRMKKNGSYINPRKATNPRAEPVTGKRLGDFQKLVQAYQNKLQPALAMRTDSVRKDSI